MADQLTREQRKALYDSRKGKKQYLMAKRLTRGNFVHPLDLPVPTAVIQQRNELPPEVLVVDRNMDMDSLRARIRDRLINPKTGDNGQLIIVRGEK